MQALLFSLSVGLTLSSCLGYALLFAPHARAQSGNFSDVTGPDLIELVPRPDNTTTEQTPLAPLDPVATPPGSPERTTYETAIQNATPAQGSQLVEGYQTQVTANHLGLDLDTAELTPAETASVLERSAQLSGQNAVFAQIVALANQAQIYVTGPQAGTPSAPVALDSSASLKQTTQPAAGSDSWFTSQANQPASKSGVTEGVTTRFTVPNLHKAQLLQVIQEYQARLSSQRLSYKQFSQFLYGRLIEPMWARLEASGADVLVVSLDDGLRGLPLAALYDGEQFLIEKYAIAVVPSFGLTDVGFKDVRSLPMLAMGASEFTDLEPLPAVPVELQGITEQFNRGQANRDSMNRDQMNGNQTFLNQDFTATNFQQQNQTGQYDVIHLATHGQFERGQLQNSFIQFFDRRVSLPELRNIVMELGWINTPEAPVELMTLSACQTAMGDNLAELGFAGLAVQVGVKSVVASLWQVSDLGTLALM
ncbi:MAG: CHAT domain-containing protein, partial [Cyanobacteria bacterium P01_H01_bin.121]